MKTKFFWMLLGALFVASAVPFIIVLLQSFGVIPALTGLIALVGVSLGMAYWLSQQISDPLSRLAESAVEIKALVNDDKPEAITPSLHSVKRIEAPAEMTQLVSRFSEMVESLQQRMVELNSVYAMGQAITANVDFEKTVQAVLAAVQQVVVFDAAEVSVLRGDRLVVEAWRGKEDFNDTTGREYRMGRGPTGIIAANKSSVLVSTISGEEEDLKRTLGYESVAGEFLVKTHKVVINSFLGIPLLFGDRLIGTLTLVHREPGRFTEADRRQLNKLAAQASVAIVNAIQVRERENALKAQIRDLRVEVDRAKLHQQVEEITTTDYFQTLQANAAKMRQRVYTKSGSADQPSSNSDTGTP